MFHIISELYIHIFNKRWILSFFIKDIKIQPQKNLQEYRTMQNLIISFYKLHMDM